MTNIPSSWHISEFKDVNTQRYWAELLANGASQAELDSARQNIDMVARDHGRTPMQWDTGAHGGFTNPEAEPWMRVIENYVDINVAAQSVRHDSVLSHWQQLLDLRQRNALVFAHGAFRYIDSGNQATITYIKEYEESRSLVVCNFTSKEQRWLVPDDLAGLTLAFGTVSNAGVGMLAPFEARIYL